MKKTIISLMMALLAALIAVAAPAKDSIGNVTITHHGDTAEIMHQGDTMFVAGPMDLAGLRDKINNVLDDTVFSSGYEIASGADYGEAMDLNRINMYWSNTASEIVFCFFVFLVVVVFIVVRYRYLTRRSKYRMIEKAIENNYPLTDAMFSDNKQNAASVPPTVVSQPAQAPSASASSPQSVPAPAPNVPAMTDWSAFNPAIKWLGIGIGLFCFGLLVDAGPFTAVGLALTAVGIAKGYICYRQQQEMKQFYRQQPQGKPMDKGAAVPPPFGCNEVKNDNNEASSIN